MSSRVREHIRGNVVGYVALFLVLTGGTAQALNGSNTVFSDDIVNRDVTTADLGFKSVTANRLAPNSVRSGRVVDDSLTGTDITGLTGADVESDSLGGNDIVEATLGPVPSAGSAFFATNAELAQNSQRLGTVPAAGYQRACRQGAIKYFARIKGDAPGFPPSSVATNDPQFIDQTFSCSGGSVRVVRIAAGRYSLRMETNGSENIPHLGVASVDPTSAAGSGADDFATVVRLQAGNVSVAFDVVVRDADGGTEDATFAFVAF